MPTIRFALLGLLIAAPAFPAPPIINEQPVAFQNLPTISRTWEAISGSYDVAGDEAMRLCEAWRRDQLTMIRDRLKASVVESKCVTGPRVAGKELTTGSVVFFK